MNPCSCGRLRSDDMDRMAHMLADHIIETEVIHSVDESLTLSVLEILAKRPRRPRRVPDFDALYRFLAPYEARMKRALKSIWGEQRRTVISNMKRTPSRTADNDRENVAAFNDLFDQWMYPAAPARKQVAAAYRKVASPLMVAQGHRTADELVAIANGPQRRSVKARTIAIAWDVYNGMIDKWLDGYMIDLADEVEVESLERLKRALQDGWKAGESISDLVKKVDSVFDDFSRYRSEMIARTESIRASAQASLLTYEASGVVDRSMWIATPTDRTCDICAGLDGKIAKLGEPFPFDDTYGDATGPPAHPNCRCCLVPVLEGE